MLEGIIASAIVWFAWTYLQPILIKRVDDAMGVLYTHGIAGLCGGLLVGIFADPSVVVYPVDHERQSRSLRPAGCTATHPEALRGAVARRAHRHRVGRVVTFIILKVISMFTPLRMSDEDLEIGDLAIHGEEAYPED